MVEFKEIHDREGTESFASISAVVFEVLRKTGRGNLPPPHPTPVVRGLTRALEGGQELRSLEWAQNLPPTNSAPVKDGITIFRG